MKRISSIIALAVVVAVCLAMPVFAATIDVGGELRARGFYVTDYSFAKNTDANWLDARFRLDAKIKQGMTTGVIQVDMLGNSTLQGATQNGNLIFGNGTGTSYDLVGVRQAYVVINFPVLNVIGGRYEVKLGNGIVLNDTSDLVAVTAPVGPVNLLVGYLVLAENDSPFGGSPTSDATAFAINAGIKNIGGSGWDGDVFGVFAHQSGPSKVVGPSDLRAYGLTGNGKIGPVDAGAEVDLFSGDATKTSSYTGTNVLITGGMPVNGIGLTGAIVYASGVSATSADTDIHAIDGDFHASNILLNNDFNNHGGVSSLDVTGLGLGLEAIKVAATLPTMKYGHSTHTPEIGVVWAQTVKKDAQGDNSIGTEIYLNTNCVFDPNLSGNIGLAYLAAGDALSATTASAENQAKLEASLTFHF